MASFMAETFDEIGLAVQWQQVEQGRANVLGTLSGAGGGPSLMFNGHMDTSYSGREPWLAHVPGFQPEPFVRDGRLYGLGISNMKGALACYVEAVRALLDAGVRLRGDVLVAAVCGEIEKAQQGDAQGAEFRGYATGTRHLVTHGGVADMCILGEPTEGKVVLGHFGSLWLRVSTPGQLHPHGVQRGQARPELDPAHARGARRGARVDPDLGGRPGERLPRREGDRQRRRAARAASAGASRARRTAPTSSSTCACRRRRRCRSRGGRCWTWCAASRAVPRLRRRGRGLRHGARRRDRRGPSARGRGRREPRRGVRLAAGARRHALVLRRLGADALRRADRQLRHVDRAAGHRVRRESRDRRAWSRRHEVYALAAQRVCGVA